MNKHGRVAHHPALAALLLLLSGALSVGVDCAWADERADHSQPRTAKMTRLQELGFGSPETLPKLHRGDFGRCLGANSSTQVEIEELNRQREALEATYREMDHESSDLRASASLLAEEEAGLALAVRGLETRSGELATRRSVFEKNRPRGTVSPAAASRFNAQIDAFNADVKRLDTERSQVNARIPGFNEKLEQYNVRASALNERISALRNSAERYSAAVGQTKEKLRFINENCGGKRVIELGS